MSQNPIKIHHYLIFALLLLYSANPHFSANNDYLQYGALISFIVALKFLSDSGSKYIYSRELLLFIFFIGYEILHGVLFEFYWRTTLRIFLQILWGFSVYVIFRERIFSAYVKIIYRLTLGGLVVYFFIQFQPVLNFLHPGITQFFPVAVDTSGYSTPTIIIYTFDSTAFTNFIRYSGFAWEAGGVASFLIPALFFNTLTQKSGLNLHNDKINRILILAIVLTFSTTAYLALFFLVLSLLLLKRSLISKLSFLPMIFLALLLYQSLPFMQEKVEAQFSTAAFTNNRFGAFLADFTMFTERPVFGWSRKLKNQFNIDEEMLTINDSSLIHRPNGVGRLLVSYGLLYFLIYFGLVFANIRSYCRSLGKFKEANYLATIFVLLLLLLGFSQLIFDKVFFKALVFFR